MTPAGAWRESHAARHSSIHIRLNKAVPEALAMQGVMEPLSMCPPVKAKFPVAELLFGDTAILNTAILPFSDNCNVRVRLVPIIPVTVPVAEAILPKQLLPTLKLRLDTLIVEEAPEFIIAVASAMLNVKLSMGEGIEALMLLIVGVATALKLPVRLLALTSRWLLVTPPHPASAKARIANRHNHVPRIRRTPRSLLLSWSIATPATVGRTESMLQVIANADAAGHFVLPG
jgi:hypothetical protein